MAKIYVGAHEQALFRNRVRSAALAELANLVDPAVDCPLFHDAEFLRAEIARVVAEVRATIDEAKAAHLAA